MQMCMYFYLRIYEIAKLGAQMVWGPEFSFLTTVIFVQKRKIKGKERGFEFPIKTRKLK